MTTTASLSISLDGYVAGPDQTLADPLGRDGESLHRWAFAEDLHEVDARWRDRILRPHAQPPIEMAGGTTFHFVTTGFADALRRAREAAGGEVDVAGGASVVRQAIAAGELDELTLTIVPVLFGGGERLFDGAVRPQLEQLEAEASARATHVRYRVGRASD